MQLNILQEIINLKNSKKEFSVITDTKTSKTYIFFANKPINIDLKSFETEIIDRKTLKGGAQKAGPNDLYQEDSTTVVPPGWTMSVDNDLTLRLRKLDNKNE